ncbi:low temperature requirement protein A [Kitasatospora viridis]|uniref:Low temperature requirement protein LtrA n=1 Tax=Kitasatospora viridis TaxID=281105 RepID=A0A561UKH6_9ACTN|nr:low temperature requirement protein A [Kitasatospora viridis]TWF99868.1 low temperature requirement protein LtrA [Kitasatospora viridis]
MPSTRHTEPLVRPMRPRRRDEPHRVATSLELFFDLCFVVAVGQAGRELAGALAEGHGTGSALLHYALAFFAVWWAWMNFTWFSSAYDCDDVPYRLTTLVQITGALIFAAGIPRLFLNADFKLAVFGYVVMRLAQFTQWLRAARGEQGAARAMARSYALGVALVQLFWVVMLLVPKSAVNWFLPIGAIAELSVPAVAERRTQSPWHPHHIAERYGLFTLIVLGETVSAATVAMQSAVDEHEALHELIPIAVGGLLICFAAWWIYFAAPIHEHLRGNRQAFLWGYGHYLVFGSAAAVGAGLEVAVEHAVGKAHISAEAAAATVTVPSAVYLFTVWLLHARHGKSGPAQWVLPVAAALVLACTALGDGGVLAAGLVAAAAIAAGLWLSTRPSVPDASID